MRIIRRLSTCATVLLYLPVVLPLGAPSATQHNPRNICPSPSLQGPELLTGEWKAAKNALRSPDCCVVSVHGLDQHLRVLQSYFADNGPSDLDLRARIRLQKFAHNDCLQLRRSVSPMEGDSDIDKNENIDCINDPCTAALVEIARGIASLADGSLEGVCEDVLLRIVCATDYRAIDPMYHTDKAPLRGYVTLRGVGTEYMTRPCSPIEYVSLRGLGKGDTKSVRQAEELEFIVMKGDHYEYNSSAMASSAATDYSWMKRIWKRMDACVHRSPPAVAVGGRRVIVSLDLADGDDDREWYQADTKREWRSGMTQRKSRLVS